MSITIYLHGPSRVERCRCDSCDNEHDRTVSDCLLSANITHNLIPMWSEAGCYDALYEMPDRPASAALPAIEAAVIAMEADPDRFRKHDAPNGWGLYENALPFLIEVRDAMREHPTATIRVSR